MKAFWLACGALAVLLAGASTAVCGGDSAGNEGEFDLGPLAGRDTTIEGEARSRILGPVYESRTSADGKAFRAVRPLFSRTIDPAHRRSRVEFLWPLASVKEFEGNKTWWFANAMGTDFDTSDPASRYRFWILPFFFKGRDSYGENYFGIFPLAGKINEIATLDKTEFFLFPLYSHNYRADVETYNILWPFLASRSGGGISMYRIFPLYGCSIREGKWVKRFVLWPILTQTRFEGEGTSGSGFILFPLFGRTYGEKEQSWLFLPPFARWTKGVDTRDVNLPWPFFRMSTGKVNRFFLWPFVGASSERGLRSSFFLWPVVSTWHRELPRETIDRWLVLPIIQCETRREWPAGEAGVEPPIKRRSARGFVRAAVRKQLRGKGEVRSRKVKIWPLVSYQRRDDAKVLRLPDLWPMTTISSVESNYTPLWTLYSQEVSSKDMRTELLWGLFRARQSAGESFASIFPLVSWRRSQENGGTRDWSLLKGLLGYRQEGTRRYLRLFYMKFERTGLESADAKERGTAEP